MALDRTNLCLFLAVLIAASLQNFLALADSDDKQFQWDPYDKSGSKAATAPDMEGSMEAPTNLWHACKFGAKKGGIFDLRALSKNEKLMAAHMGQDTEWFRDNIQLYDWIHQDVTQFNVTYYLNVCADVIEVPEVCQKLKMTEPAPAYQVTATGHCHYLGTLKSFKWKPIDTLNPSKGMMLYYQNGGSCGNQGQTKTIKYIFTCSRYYDQDDGPMVVYQTNACEYHVVWPSKFGCPEGGLLSQLGIELDSAADGSADTNKTTIFAILLVMGVCAIAAYFLKQRSGSIGGYSSL